jgi:hypothetical protein
VLLNSLFHPPTLYVHILGFFSGKTKVQHISLFPFVCITKRDGRCPDTLWTHVTLNPCYAGSGLVMETCRISPRRPLHDRTPKCLWEAPRCVWAPPDRYILKEQNDNLGQKEAGSTFILPAITTICTYNVGVCSLYMLTHRFWLWKLIRNPPKLSLSSTKHMWFGLVRPNVAAILVV